MHLTRLLIRPNDVLSSDRAEPVEALRPFVKLTIGQAQGERFKLYRAGAIGCFLFSDHAAGCSHAYFNHRLW